MSFTVAVCAVLSCVSVVMLILSVVFCLKGKSKEFTISISIGLFTALFGFVVINIPDICDTVNSFVPDTCSNCGEDYTVGEDRYCKKCGNELDTVSATCECGKVYYVSDNATFCVDCGNKLE